MLLVLGIGVLTPKNLDGGLIAGSCYKSHNNVSSDSTDVSCWINNGDSGTQHDIIDDDFLTGYYSFDSGNFIPVPFLSDTIKVSAEKVDNGKTYLTHAHKIRGEDNTILPTLFLDDPDKNVVSQAINIGKVKDESGLDDTLRATAWLQKNLNQKIDYTNFFLQFLGEDSTSVDTSDIFPQVYINLEKQDSTWNVGDTVIVELYKTIGSTKYYDEFKIPIDTLKYGMATVQDSVVYKGEKTGTTALQQVSFAKPIIKGDTIILNYKCDNAVGYKILRKDNNQEDFKVISSTEKSQYKDVVQNGIYEYNIQAIGNDGKVLNEQSFKVKNYGKEKCMSKVFYYGQKNLKEELKGREVYDITGKLINDVSRLPYGIYLIK